MVMRYFNRIQMSPKGRCYRRERLTVERNTYYISLGKFKHEFVISKNFLAAIFIINSKIKQLLPTRETSFYSPLIFSLWKYHSIFLSLIFFLRGKHDL